MNQIFTILLFFDFLLQVSANKTSNKTSKMARLCRVRTTNQLLSLLRPRSNSTRRCSFRMERVHGKHRCCLYSFGTRMGWDDDDSWISLVLDRRKQSRLNVSLISLWSFVHAGWVPSIHWGPSTIREVFLVHVVQPTSRQEALLQEARKTDESRRGTSVQGGASGEWFFNFPLFVLSWYSVREIVSWRHASLDRYIFQRIKLYISNLIIFESISNFRFSSW